MKREGLVARGTCLLMVIVVTIGVTSCGTILYPERRGQPAGKIDAGVAVLDGIGLLFFLIPGVIAFAVDFTTGTIYLPPDSSRSDIPTSNLQDARAVQPKLESINRHEIEALLETEIGQKIDLASPGTKVARALPSGDMAWVSIEDVLTPNQLVAFENNTVDAFR